MISGETVKRLWQCQREVAVGKALLEEMKKIAADLKDNASAERIRDAFGREQDLQLGVPSGRDCHRLLNVSPTLAVSIILAHIANKEAELAEANEQARIELNAAPQENKDEKQASA